MKATSETGYTSYSENDYREPYSVWHNNSYGLRKTLLCLSMPIEVFFRYNFGQRWLTFGNFLGGLLILSFFILLEYGWNELVLSPTFYYLQGFFLIENAVVPFRWHIPFMWFFWGCYVLRCGHHFFRMFFRSRTGTEMHTFNDGWSIFEGLAFKIMRVLNVALKPFVLLGMFLSLKKRERKQAASVPLVFQNITAFADTFIEPLILLIGVWLIPGLVVKIWLLCSCYACFVCKRRKRRIRKYRMLDFKDAMIEARDLKGYRLRQEYINRRNDQEPEIVSHRSNKRPPRDNRDFYDLAEIIDEENKDD
jgi:hypothetical protein